MSGRRASVAAVSLLVAAQVTATALDVVGAHAPAAGAETRFVDSLPRYEAQEQVSGTIRLWGHGSPKRDFMGQLTQHWVDGFRRHHPAVTFENRMYGTASAIGALYAGVGDVAILGEEIHPAAAAAFERAMGYPPLGIEIATGSLNVRNFDYAHVFFVHADNPLARLTVAQLDGVFGSEHRRGPANIRTWGQLGLAGEWADEPIHPYGWRLDDDFALYLRDALLAGSHRWNNELREFGHRTRPDGSVYDHGQQILAALAADRFGIAVSNPRYATDRVKALALAATEGGPYYEATRENLISRQYPFTRIIPAFVRRAPGRPLDPKVREFLRYILSREGQRDIVRDGGYLPLGEDAIRRQRLRLD
jgi:phosphate transport system substrate-binding protein